MDGTRSATRELLRGNVLWLSLVSLLNDAASEMIYPLLPAFVVQLGAGPAFLGLIEGVAEATASLTKLAGGWISDRVGKRKALAVWGYAIAAFARPFVAVALAAWQVLIVRFADRVGKGVRTAPRDALLAESVAPARRGAAFGIHRAADHAGAVIGPLLATALVLLLPGRLRLVFALAALPGLLAVALLVWRVRESATVGGASPRPVGPAAAATDGRALPRLGIRGLGPTFRRYLAVVVIFTLGNASDAFLLLRAQQLGVAVALLPILWAAFHVSKMVWNVVGGGLADRAGPRAAIVGGWLVYAATYAAFAFATTAWQAWALFLVYGVFFGLTEAPEKLLVVRLAPADARGTAFGAYHFSVGLAALPASLLFGEIWQHAGPEAAFLTGAGLAVAAALALPLLVRDRVATGPG
ncbi:MAG: MFS transporter [Gemmatimonadetes bacterium]|nr:MFS transporter [Gemmatimonadota bacterium]